MSLLLGILIAAFGFGGGYHTHSVLAEDPGCDTALRAITNEYAEQGMELAGGQGFSNGFAVTFLNKEKLTMAVNIFTNEAPPAEDAANWLVKDTCITGQGQVLTRYVRADSFN